jgi:hypothetical protein
MTNKYRSVVENLELDASIGGEQLSTEIAEEPRRAKDSLSR